MAGTTPSRCSPTAAAEQSGNHAEGLLPGFASNSTSRPPAVIPSVRKSPCQRLVSKYIRHRWTTTRRCPFSKAVAHGLVAPVAHPIQGVRPLFDHANSSCQPICEISVNAFDAGDRSLAADAPYRVATRRFRSGSPAPFAGSDPARPVSFAPPAGTVRQACAHPLRTPVP